MSRCYLYLARRDKMGARVVTVLDGPQRPPIRLVDLESLKLPPTIHASVEKIIYDNRMYWEPWIESAEHYQELRKKLHARGFQGLYPSCKPLFDGTSFLLPPKADLKKHPKKKTMLTRKS
jgi:hypothetical protein